MNNLKMLFITATCILPVTLWTSQPHRHSPLFKQSLIYNQFSRDFESTSPASPAISSKPASPEKIKRSISKEDAIFNTQLLGQDIATVARFCDQHNGRISTSKK